MGERLIPISDLFAVPRPDDQLVAADGHGPAAWRDFVRDVAGLAARIAAAPDSRPGRRWLVVEGDSYALAVGVFGTLQADCTPMLPANLQPGHLAELAATAYGVITATEPPSGTKNCLPTFDAASAGGTAALHALDPASVEIVLHTSGTTGVPLAVPKPLRLLEAEIASATQAFAPQPGLMTHATVPPYHIYGLIYRVLWPLATQRPFSADMIAYPEELVAAVGKNSGGMLISSPAFLRRALPALDLDRLKDFLGPVLSSGGPLPSNVAASYNAVLPARVTEVYGSTETGGIAYRAVTDAAAPELWNPLPDVEVRIDAEEDVLAIRSPMLPDDGWALCSDRANLHADGRFELLGRADRVVKIEEKRVSLPEIEQRLVACPSVEAARVIALPVAETQRQMLGAVIEPSAEGWDLLAASGKPALRNLLQDALKPYLSAVVLPRRWRFVTRLPEDERGKTSNGALVALFDEHQGRRVDPVVVDRATDEDTLVLHLQLPKELTYFDGHFDEAPILAGVVQIDWAIRFAREHFSITGSFRRIEALKFFKILMAGGSVTLDLGYDPANRRVTFRYHNGETNHSSGRIVFDTTP